MAYSRHLKNLFRSKYFVVFTLLSLWLGLQVGYYGLHPWPESSLQLSSEATEDSGAKVALSEKTEKFYDLQLRFVKDQRVTISGKRVNLEKGTLISISVPRAALGKSTDAKNINLSDVLAFLRKNSDFTKKNEFTIMESKNPDLIGESAILRLRNLARKSLIKLDSVEEESDDIADNSSEASVCNDCLGISKPGSKYGQFSFSNIYDKFTSGSTSKENKIASIEELVKQYESSIDVKKLMNTVNSGYTVQYKGRTLRVKNGVATVSARGCYKGVKIALQKSGMTNIYLGGSAAKDAGKYLEHSGFINLMKTSYKEKIKSAYDCPKGAVIVYGGGSYGHAEICTGTGFVSDFYSKRPRTGGGLSGRGRRVTGIYIKSNTEFNSYLALNDTKKKDAQNEKHY